MAHSAEVHAAVLTAEVHAAVLTAEVHVVVRSAAVPIAEDSAVAALAAVVPLVEARTVEVRTVVDTAEAVAAEWADTDKSEHQFPDFRIRHLRNLAH